MPRDRTKCDRLKYLLKIRLEDEARQDNACRFHDDEGFVCLNVETLEQIIIDFAENWEDT